MTDVADGTAPRRSARPLGQLAVPIYLPGAVYAIGNGAVTPMLAITAHELGASLSLAGLVAGMPLLGRLLGDTPSGALVARFGEKVSMLLAGGLTLVATAMVLLVDDLVVLTVAGLLMGVATAVFMLARHAYITEVVPVQYRGRALAMLAGTVRTGMAVGPFVTAALLGVVGSYAAYWIQVVTTVGVVAFLLCTPDLESDRVNAGHDHGHGSSVEVFRAHSGVFLTLGVGISTLMMLRMARPIIVPLWGLAIGLDASLISVVMGVSGLLEVALFYSGGMIADRFGRIWVAVPVTAGMALGTAALALADTREVFYVVTGVIALANSLGGGIMMTMGSDLAATRGQTSQFLGVWRLFSDGASAAAPLLISAATAVSGPGLAAVAIGGIGVLGAMVLLRWMPTYFAPASQG